MHYTTIASQLKAKHPEYANRDDRELVEKYIQRFPEKASFIEFDDYGTPTQTQQEEPKKPITKEEVGDYLKGASQTLSQGLMLGQAPHVSGVLNESINTPQKVYNAQSLRDLVDVYKGLGKDYVKSREQFKEEQGKFEEENPKTALALEMIGGLGSTGGGLGLLRSGRSLLRQVLKGGLEGGAIGSMFGASNTKGKAIDFKNAGLGALLGGGLGSTLGVGLPVGMKVAQKTGDLIGTLGRLWSKGVDAVADRVTPVKYIKNPMRELQKAEEKAIVGKGPKINIESVVRQEIDNELGKNLYYLNKEAKKLRDIKQNINDNLFEGVDLEDDTINFLNKKGISADEEGMYVEDEFGNIFRKETDIKEKIVDSQYEVESLENRIARKDFDDVDEITEDLEYEKKALENLKKLYDEFQSSISKMQNYKSKNGELSQEIEKLYSIKQDVLNKLNPKIEAYHGFDNGDVRPMYKIGDYEFHGNPTNDVKEFVPYSEIEGQISSENKLANDIKSIDDAIKNIQNILQNKQMAQDTNLLNQVTKSAQSNLPSIQNPLRETESAKLPTTKSRDILANPKSMDEKYAYGYVQDYLPEQNLVINTLKKDRKVLEKVASGEDVGRHFDKFGEDAVNGLKEIKDTIKKAENEAYKKAGITDEYMLEGNKFVNDVENAINKYKKDVRTRKADEDVGDKFLNDVLDEWTKNDGKISFGMLKNFSKEVNNLRTQVRRNQAKGDSSSEYDLWRNISRIISNTKNSDVNLKAPNKMTAELFDAIEDFEANTGLNLDKPKGFAKNFFSSARDRADGGIYEQALDDFASVVEKYDGTKILGDLPSKIRMAKVSYVLRPSTKDSKLSRDVVGALHPERFAKRKIAEALVGKPISSEEYYRILAKRMLKGEITPQQLEGKFRKVKLKGMSEDESNELLVKYLLLGKEGTGVFPSILAGMVKGGIK